MFSNLFTRINQKWNEFLYGPFCTNLRDLFFSDDCYITIESKQDKQHQNIDIATSSPEIITTSEKEDLKWLTQIDYSLGKFTESEICSSAKERMIALCEKVLHQFSGAEAEKIERFINDHRNSEWEIVNENGCGLSEQEDDTCISDWEIVEKVPSTEIRLLGITAKNKDGKTLFDLSGCFMS
ncbi:MAG: hypothetical protein LBU56_05045 [Rickettsiales bacterium]|jgi:hypothetical protein|nr:hypothetical protein [Rickettsiales bacterium]